MEAGIRNRGDLVSSPHQLFEKQTSLEKVKVYTFRIDIKGLRKEGR